MIGEIESVEGSIYIPQDAEGLRIAARELFEESFDAPARERTEMLAECAENREEMLASILSRRTLSPGYYSWIGFIASTVEPAVEGGFWCDAGEMDDDEFVGLQALKQARAEFHRDHPPCGGCGTPLEMKGMSKCHACTSVEMRTRFAERRR